MPRGEGDQFPVNTRILLEAASDVAGLSTEFSVAGKKSGMTTDCAAVLANGTGLANKALPLGCGPSAPIRSRFAHGGARNRADRTSLGLTLNQSQALMNAAHRAVVIDRPLNRWITIHWQAAGLRDDQAMRATTVFLKYWREWLGGNTAYLWVRESGGGKGSHLHILAHLPINRVWSGRRGTTWIERITGDRYKAQVILTKPIAGAGQPEGKLYDENLQAVLAYALKGALPEVAEALGFRCQPGGRVIGKRCGTSRNLSH
jgi:hypothetical protein